MNEGDETDSLYILLSGRVKVFNTGDDGRGVVVNVIEAGDYFGELSLEGGARSFNMVSVGLAMAAARATNWRRSRWNSRWW